MVRHLFQMSSVTTKVQPCFLESTWRSRWQNLTRTLQQCGQVIDITKIWSRLRGASSWYWTIDDSSISQTTWAFSMIFRSQKCRRGNNHLTFNRQGSSPSWSKWVEWVRSLTRRAIETRPSTRPGKCQCWKGYSRRPWSAARRSWSGSLAVSGTGWSYGSGGFKTTCTIGVRWRMRTWECCHSMWTRRSYRRYRSTTSRIAVWIKYCKSQRPLQIIFLPSIAETMLTTLTKERCLRLSKHLKSLMNRRHENTWRGLRIKMKHASSSWKTTMLNTSGEKWKISASNIETRAQSATKAIWQHSKL